MTVRYTAHLQLVPRTWLGRILTVFVALALLALGFFFLVAALIGFCLLMLVLIFRALWPGKAQAPTVPNIVEGEFRVERPHAPSSDARTRITQKE